MRSRSSRRLCASRKSMKGGRKRVGGKTVARPIALGGGRVPVRRYPYRRPNPNCKPFGYENHTYTNGNNKHRRST